MSVCIRTQFIGRLSICHTYMYIHIYIYDTPVRGLTDELIISDLFEGWANVCNLCWILFASEAGQLTGQTCAAP